MSFPDSPAKPQSPSPCWLTGLALARLTMPWRTATEAKEEPSLLHAQQLSSCSPAPRFHVWIHPLNDTAHHSVLRTPKTSGVCLLAPAG